MEALGINLGYVLLQIFNFLILFIVLRAWVYKPVTNVLAKRRAAIAKGLEDARVAADARANAESEAQKVIADAQAKAGQVIREATDRAELAAREVKTKAEEEITKQRSSSLAETEQERNRMLGDLRTQVAALAIAATQKLLGEALDEKRQHALVEEFFSGVKNGKVMVLESSPTLKGELVEVVSALPLNQSEQKTVEADVLKQIGSSAKVSYKVDPSILGGLVIRAGDKLIDGSVAGQLDELKQNLQ